MQTYQNTPTSVLMSTFKSGLPENQFDLMETVKRVRIFTARPPCLDGHHIFFISHSLGTQRTEPAVWIKGTTVRSGKGNSD